MSFTFAYDGVEALAALKANGDIDLVVTDINMPRMDGLSLLQKLQENEDNIMTVIVSAYGDMTNIRTAMNRGAFDFVTKPIDFSDLETTDRKDNSATLGFCEMRVNGRPLPNAAHASLSRYFSPNLAQRLAGDTAAVDLEGHRREIATLFTDIASFTALVETLEPNVLGPLLNEYLSGMTDIVFSNDGTVAKIVGDALHILFGAPGEQPDHAARAVACALALDEFAQSFCERWQKKGIAFGVTRIGVHAGPAIVGNFGGGRFFDYTAYGDTINVASRLETANKQLGTRICVSAELAEGVENFRGRPIGDLVLRGRGEVIRALNRCRKNSSTIPQQKAISMRTPCSRPRMPARLRPLRLMSASSRRTALRLFISSGCLMEPRARALRWISGASSRLPCSANRQSCDHHHRDFLVAALRYHTKFDDWKRPCR